MSEQTDRAIEIDYKHRLRHCFYGDTDTHAARNVGIVNIQTACGRWVWPKYTRPKQRFAPITCDGCRAVAESPATASTASTPGTEAHGEAGEAQEGRE